MLVKLAFTYSQDRHPCQLDNILLRSREIFYDVAQKPGTIDESCLFPVDVNRTFEQAQLFCSNYYGNLVFIGSLEENRKILELTKSFSEAKFIWLGGSFDGKKITWIDGSPAVFSGLSQGTAAGKLILNVNSGNWNGMLPFVCLSQPQNPSDQPPSCPPYSPCPSDWIYSESLKFCYRVIFNVDFTTADQNCRLMGSMLASIHSEEENSFVNDLAKSGSTHPKSEAHFEPLLGGKRTGSSQLDWVWIDGSPFNYIRWSPNQSDSDRELCLQNYSDQLAVDRRKPSISGMTFRTPTVFDLPFASNRLYFDKHVTDIDKLMRLLFLKTHFTIKRTN